MVGDMDAEGEGGTFIREGGVVGAGIGISLVANSSGSSSCKPCQVESNRQGIIILRRSSKRAFSYKSSSVKLRIYWKEGNPVRKSKSPSIGENQVLGDAVVYIFHRCNSNNISSSDNFCNRICTSLFKDRKFIHLHRCNSKSSIDLKPISSSWVAISS